MTLSAYSMAHNQPTPTVSTPCAAHTLPLEED